MTSTSPTKEKKKEEKQQSAFERIPNNYIVGNPIKSKEMFFGRENDFLTISEWIENESYKVILLKGGRRSGKTSILYQIANGRMVETAEAVFCDFHHISPQLETDEDLPHQIGNVLTEVEIFSQFHESFNQEKGSWTAKLGQLIRSCLDKIAPKKLVFLCDEYEALEDPFSSGKLTSKALVWFEDVKNLDIYFVMTGSKPFTFSKHLSPRFGPVSGMLEVSTLSKPDAIDLIVNPVKNYLEYRGDSIERIYRLSGGHPFYTQYVCQSLVSHVNASLHRYFIMPNDLEEVVQFIIRNPTGHIQETWRSLPFKTKHALAALAGSLNSSEDYVKPENVLQIVQDRRFILSDKDLFEAVSWLKKETSLLDWDSEYLRFNIDIFRFWIERYFQTGEDIDSEIDSPYSDTSTSNLQPKKNDQKTSSLGLKKIVAICGITLLVGAIGFYLISGQGSEPLPKPEPEDKGSFTKGECVQIKDGVEPCTGWEEGMKGTSGQVTQVYEKYILVNFPKSHPVVKDKVVCPQDIVKVSCD